MLSKTEVLNMLQRSQPGSKKDAENYQDMKKIVEQCVQLQYQEYVRQGFIKEEVLKQTGHPYLEILKRQLERFNKEDLEDLLTVLFIPTEEDETKTSMIKKIREIR